MVVTAVTSGTAWQRWGQHQGGNGGNLGPAGFGGGAGDIRINAFTKVPPEIKKSAKPGAKGTRTTQPGQGGSGHPNGQPRSSSVG